MGERPLLTVVSPPAPEPEISAPRPAPPPPKRPLSAVRVLDAVGRFAVVAVVAVVAAFALAPRLVKGDLPSDPALLGTPARGVVKADRDYALVDAAATNALQRQAAERSRPLWDLDDDHARRDAQVLQKVLVRVAVALEAVRKQSEAAPSSKQEPPASAKQALEDVRAVVAGELAGAGLEAPQDAAWRALITLVWQQPGAVDVVAGVVAADLPNPITLSDAPAGEIAVRSLAEDRAERVVGTGDVVTVAQARERLQKRLQAALLESAPSSLHASGGASALSSWLSSFVRPTLTWNAAETERRRRAAAESVPPVIVRAHRGETVLRPGEIITVRHQLLARAMEGQQGDALRRSAQVGTGFFVGLVVVVVYLFGARRVFQRRLRLRDVVFLGVMLSLSLALLVAADATAPALVATFPGVQTAMVAFVIPVAFGPMIVRLTLTPDVALLFSLVLALLGGVVVEAGMSWAVVAALSSMTGVAFVVRGPRRLVVVAAGVVAGGVGVFAVLTLELFRGALVGTDLAWLSLVTFTGGALSGVLAAVVVPVVERAFGYVTDARLYALADLNHPLLKDMIVHAPGTWHHSVRAAVLAERAAQAVGANPLLARVMALYHDIGKIPSPASFRENQHDGQNPHDKIAPEESAAILRGHVEEGLALAKAHGIPGAVAVVIEEHHADMVMESFLEKARHRARDSGAAVDDRVYRYVGRLPQTKESALVLLADQIEATARNLGAEATPSKLAEIVDHFVNRALTHDTLAACELSLKDLGRARQALKEAVLDLSRPADKSDRERR